MHVTPWWVAGADGGLECSNSEPCIDRAADGVTYDPTGPSIEDRSVLTPNYAIGALSVIAGPANIFPLLFPWGKSAILSKKVVFLAISF